MPATMSPYQHGEVYVTDDGAETDLDLGNYGRFTTAKLSRSNSITQSSLQKGHRKEERPETISAAQYRSFHISLTKSKSAY